MPKKSPLFFYISFLSLLAMLGYFASDMYLPAMPGMVHSLNTSKAVIQLTISVYLIGFALGQLFYGSFSDRFGRKKLLSLGLTLFVLGSLGCALSPNVHVLLISRVLQALGACSATVLWQTIVLDKYGADGSHQLFAIIMPLLALSPAIAPAIGGWLTEAFSWRIVFFVLTGIGLITLLFTSLTRETTSAEHREHNRVHLHTILKNYRTLLSSVHFVGYVGMVCLATSCFFTYLAGSPFALKAMGFTPHQIGLAYIPQTLCFMLGGFISKKLHDRMGRNWILAISLSLTFICGILLTYYSWHGFGSSLEIIAPFLLVAISNGMIYPTCLAKALNHFPKLTGAAAGLSGCMQALTAFLATLVVASLAAWGNIAMSGIILALGSLNLLLFWWVTVHVKKQPHS